MTEKTEDNVFKKAEETKKTTAKASTTKTTVDEVLETEEAKEESTPEPKTTSTAKTTKTTKASTSKAKEDDMSNDLREKIKGRLEVLGVHYSDDFSTDDLVKLFEDKMEEFSNTVEPTEVEDLLRQYTKEQANRLIRIRAVCMNPAKSSLKGEFFTVGNRTIGVIKKFVPYNTEAMDSGWHVPFAIYEHLKNREFYPPSSRKNKFGMDEPVITAMPEFSIEVLPALTQEEIDEIAKHQRANNTVNRA